MRYILFASILLSGCDSQTRSSYQLDGMIDGKPVTIEVRGLENTATATPNIAAIVSATTAGLRGDLAGVLERINQISTPPAADPPYAAGGAALTAIVTALGLAYAKHREAQNWKADSNEGWQKADEANKEAMKLARALPPGAV